MMNNTEQLQAHRLHLEYCESLRRLAQIMHPYTFLRREVADLEAVASGVLQPFNVAMFGRMKTGKSSLINALIGKQLAITGVEETTATINRLSYADGEQLNIFTAHWKDDAPESFPLERLQSEWNGTSEEVLERIQRVSHLELYSNIPRLRDILIIDTPGTGSTASAHDAVAQQFIRGQQADALVYVFSSVGRETDEETLISFRKGCLPGSDPYNSVAVLHKWDHIYWENGGDMDDIRAKAARLSEMMRQQVADVLPVSAPLAMLAKCASPKFWDSCRDLLASFPSEEELTRALSRDSKWDRNPDGMQLRTQAIQECGLPWASFQVAMRHLYRCKPENTELARRQILVLSGIEAFESMLDERFFTRQAIIRQRQTRARAQRALDAIYDRIETYLASREKELVLMEKAEAELHTPELKEWLSQKLHEEIEQCRILKEEWQKMDANRIHLRDEKDREDNSVELLTWLNSVPARYLSAEQVAILCDLLHTRKTDAHAAQLPALYKRVIMLAQLPDEEIKRRGEQLKSVLISILQNKS